MCNYQVTCHHACGCQYAYTHRRTRAHTQTLCDAAERLMMSQSHETLQVRDNGSFTIGQLELKEPSVKLLRDNSRPNYV